MSSNITIPRVENIPDLPPIDLALASAAALCWVGEAHHLSRGVSDHGPLCLTLSLANSVDRSQWHIFGYWDLHTKIQESLMEAICNYWVLNQNLANYGVMWHAFNPGVGGNTYPEFPQCRKRRSVHWGSWRKRFKGQRGCISATEVSHTAWQQVLWELALYRIERTK